jgi:hypothetical protein
LSKTLEEVLIEILEFAESVHLGENEHSSTIIEEDIREVCEEEHTTCPRCKKQMIKTSTIELGTTNLLLGPKYKDKWWWCGCGYREFIEHEYFLSKEEELKQRWEEINKE